jgi:hypothetical protein
MDPKAAPVFRTWSLPNLKFLKSSAIHNTDAYLRHSSSLEGLQWFPTENKFNESTFTKALEYVSLNLRYLRIEDHESYCVHDSEAHVVLPSLTAFKCTVDSQEFLRLLQRISMPALAELSLRIHRFAYSSGEFLPWLRTLNSPELKKVDVFVGETEHCEEISGTIRRVFLEGPKREDLVIEITTRQQSHTNQR